MTTHENAYRLGATLAELALAGVEDPFDARDRAALARLGYRRIEDEPPEHNHFDIWDAPEDSDDCPRCRWETLRAEG